MLQSEDYRDYPSRFPAIFKPLAWWEEREEWQMPEYVKRTRSDKTIEVLRVLDKKHNRREFGHEPDTIEHRFIYPYAQGYEPATEQEYLNSLTNK